MTDITQDLVLPDPTTVEAYQPGFTTPAIQRMEIEAQALETAYKFAFKLSKTQYVAPHFQQSFVPKGKSQPLGEQAAFDLAVAILFGAEIGLSALQSAQDVFTVKGKPAVYARVMVSQVLAWIDKRIATGRTSPDPATGDGVWEVSAAMDSVVWAGRRDGRPASSEWTIQRAKQAGFTSNEKYQQQPIEMLRAKCQSEVCRILFPDVLRGMGHSAEELQLSDGVSIQVVRPAPGARGVGGLQAMLEERAQQAAAVVVDEAEPGQGGGNDQQEGATPSAGADPFAPAGDQDPAGDGMTADKGGQGPAAEGTPPPSPATRKQLTDIKRLLATVEKLTDPKHPDALTLVGSLASCEISDLAELTEQQAETVITELGKGNQDG